MKHVWSFACIRTTCLILQNTEFMTEMFNYLFWTGGSQQFEDEALTTHTVTGQVVWHCFVQALKLLIKTSWAVFWREAERKKTSELFHSTRATLECIFGHRMTILDWTGQTWFSKRLLNYLQSCSSYLNAGNEKHWCKVGYVWLQIIVLNCYMTTVTSITFLGLTVLFTFYMIPQQNV